MDRWKLLIVLGFLASSGCISNGGGQGISVETISAEPEEIMAGNDLTVILEVENSGLLEGRVFPGNQNKNILTNYCPDIFKITETDVNTIKAVEDSEKGYLLKEGGKLQFSWELLQEGPAEIPPTGFSCDLTFELPFNYSTRSYKQVQIIEDRSVETNAELQSEVSEGPLTFDMEISESRSKKPNTILADDDASLLITSYNKEETDESKYTGSIETSDINLETTGALNIDDTCLQEGRAVLASGEEKIYRCDIQVSEQEYNPPSSRGEISAEINYTYIREIGEKTVKVSQRGQ